MSVPNVRISEPILRLQTRVKLIALIVDFIQMQVRKHVQHVMLYAGSARVDLHLIAQLVIQ